MPTLPAAGAVSRVGCGEPAAAAQGRILLGSPGAEPRRRLRAAPPGRARPGGPRRESHRTDVHGRRAGRERGVGRAGPPRARVRDPALLARAGRRVPARGRLHHRGPPLRPARQPAHSAGAPPLREVPGGGAAAAHARPGRARPRADRLRRLPVRGRCRRAAAPASPAPLRPRRGVRPAVRRDPDRHLSSQPAEHADGQADLDDVRVRLRGGAPTGSALRRTRSARRRPSP